MISIVYETAIFTTSNDEKAYLTLLCLGNRNESLTDESPFLMWTIFFNHGILVLPYEGS